MHRLGFERVLPDRLPKQTDLAVPAAFIASYESRMNGLRPDKRMVFTDAVHPEHQSRTAVRVTMGRQRVNIHGDLDFEAMWQVRKAGERINARTTIALFKRIKGTLPGERTVYLFHNIARYHHAKILKPWLERPECCIKLHFLTPYPPHRT